MRPGVLMICNLQQGPRVERSVWCSTTSGFQQKGEGSVFFPLSAPTWGGRPALSLAGV
jgi:hypothetical protein